MIAYRDYNGTWHIDGYHDLEFSTEHDARAAIDLALRFASYQAGQESRYRRAAERAKEMA